MKASLRKAILLAALGTFAVTISACHPPSSVVTPAGKAAYTADQVVKRVGEFQDAVIQLNKVGTVKDADAVRIVRFCVDTAKTLKVAPAGWQAAFVKAWALLKKDVPLLAAPPLNTYASIVDGMIASGGF